MREPDHVGKENIKPTSGERARKSEKKNCVFVNIMKKYRVTLDIAGVSFIIKRPL